MLRCSDFVFAYVDAEDRLVGFARVLTDHVYKAFLFDVIVRPAYRGTGLGRRIMHDVTSHPVLSQVASIELYCRPELNAFYESFGFARIASGEIDLMRRARPHEAGF
jgi:predicted GNAT family N-acyltransferase